VALAVIAPPARSASAYTRSTVTAWPWTDPYGCFAEGLALGPDGSLYASVTTWGDEIDLGQVVKVAPATGVKTQLGPTLQTPGLLTGLAFDAQGRLYVGSATFSDDDRPGVYRVGESGLTRVLTLPANSFPNGLLFRDGYLYVTDSAIGAIWRTSPDTATTPAVPWFQDARLAPSGGGDIGVNGIATKGDSLYVSVASPGRIVKIQVKTNGLPGTVGVAAESNLLRSADGIAFDASGNLWITANYPGSGRLLELAAGGRLKVVVEGAHWLDYPTTPVFAPTREGVSTVYVENGGYVSGLPSIVSLGGLLP
jgi:sugar lactone lactonase YvrE